MGKKTAFWCFATAMFYFLLPQTMISAAEPVPWKRDFSLGYTQTNGNTKKSSLLANLEAAKMQGKSELNFKANLFYSSSNDKMDGQKWYGMGRYGLKIWNEKWVNFYKFEADHDRFSNINYRLIPSTGLGYWFSNTDDWKSLTELGIGLTYTNYRDDTKDTSEATVIPRAFFDKRLFNQTHLSEDVTVYPSLKDTEHYRVHSETVLNNPISKKLSVRLSLIDDFNSNPADEKKKNDTQFILSLNYSF